MTFLKSNYMKNFLLVFWISIPFLSFSQVEANLLGHWHDENITPANFNNPYHDVWGVVVNGIEYGIISSTDGFHFFDMTTQPLSNEPVAFGQATIQGSQIGHRDIKTYQNYLYAVADEGPSALQIFDLSGLPNSVELVYESNWFLSQAHNIFIDEDNARLYAVGGNGFHIKILSLDNPEEPTLLGSYPDANYTSVSTHDVYVRDHVAYLNSAFSGLIVTDFSDPANPVTLGSMTDYPQSGYNHSGWLSDDGQYYFLCDETHGTDIKVVDVSDYGDIKVVATMNAASTSNQIVHNVYIRGDVLYASYYYDGLQVFDISNPLFPYRIEYYDTTDEVNTSYYAGAWGIFVLPSGMSLISDMQTGLYFFDEKLNTSVIPSATSFEICEGLDYTFTILLGDDFEPSGVNLSTGSLPTGTTVEFNSNPAEPGEEVEVTISGADAGSFYLEIFATDDTNNGQTTIAIEAIVVESASLVNPLDEETVLVPNIDFTWTSADNANIKSIEISTSESDFESNIFFTEQVNNSSYTFTDELAEGTSYYWRIVADYGCGETISEIYSFTTEIIDNVKESIQGNVFSLSPNPADGLITLRFENPLEKELNIKLMFINGQMIKTFQMESQSNVLRLPVSDLSEGLYILRLISGKNTLSKKILIQR